MRLVTPLPHDVVFVGRLWNPQAQTGTYDNSRAKIDMIILHSMDGYFDGTTQWFLNPTTKTSAHYGVGMKGQVRNFIPENATAYHSGQYSINQRSIGIEHEDLANNKIVRSEELYEASAQLVADIARFYDIPLDRNHIKKHNEIVATACPGTLDVDRIVNRAREINQTPKTPAAEEPLKDYKMTETTFMRTVTKSTEYDNLWAALGLPEDQKGNVGSHKLVIQYINQRVDELKGNSNAGSSTVTAPQMPTIENIPSQQSISFWRKDVMDILNNILGAVRKPKNT